MRQPLVFSATFHLCLILIALFGLDMLPKKKMEMPIPISVAMVNPSDVARTNHDADPVDEPEQPPVHSRAPEPPKEAKSSTPPPPPPPVDQKVETPPPPQKLAPPPPQPAPEPLKKPTPPVEKVQPIKQTQTLFQEPPKLPPLQKPAVVTPPPPKPKPESQKQVQSDFDSMLTNLAPVDKADEVSKQKPIKAKPQQGAHAEAGPSMTADEMALIRERLKQCWLPPAGSLNADQLIVHVVAKYNEGKMLTAATLVDTDDRYNRDPSYRAAADSALRALRNPSCNPLPWPDGKYNDWNSTQIDFDPKMLSQ